MLCMALGTFTLIGQARVVSGTVLEAADNAPLPGVTVSVKGTTAGTITDMSGRFEISVPQDADALVFSFIGMLTQQIALGEQTEIEIVMEATSLALDEVVVTALGVSREKKSLGYAVQELNGQDVNNVKSDNIINSLSGKLAGVQVKANSNFGGSTNIIIRGSGSLTQNNQALFVVDGVPISNAITNNEQQEDGRSGFDYGNAVSDLNSNDIASLSVLKGAAATALYGSRAANGVILITTKKGSNNKSLGVSISSNVTVGIVDQSTFPKYQKKYGPGYIPWTGSSDIPGLDWDDLNGDGNLNTDDYLIPYYDDGSMGAPMDGSMVYHYDAWVPESPNYGQKRPFLPSENDALSFFENAVALTNSVEVSGGSDKATFRTSYTNKDQSGLYPNSSMKRNSLNFSGSYKILDKLTVSTSVNYINTKTKNRNGTGYSANLMSWMRQWYQVQLDMDLQDMLYQETGRNISWNRTWWDNPDPLYWDNPYWVMYENYPEDQRTRLIGYVKADWEITDYLSLMGRMSADTYSSLQEEKLAVGSIAQEFGTGSPRQEVTSGYSRFDTRFIETNLDFLLNFHKDLSEKINLTALLGTNIRRSTMDRLWAATNGGLAVPNLYSLSNSIAPMLPPDEKLDIIGVNGIFGSVSLGISNLVYLDATLRRDQSSTLPIENNSYYYPSVSGSFLFNNLIKADWLQLGKIRLNYAVVGNDAPPRSVLDTYDAKAPLSGNTLASVAPIKKNSNLVPEKSKSLEAGLEMTMFQNRVGFDMAVYKTNTINQLMPVDVSFATGYRSTWVNAGEIENRGIELAMYLTPVRKSEFSWNVSINWAKNVNKVLSLFTDDAGNEVQNLQIADLQGNVSINARVGQPYGTIQSIDYIYHESGKPMIGSNGHYLTSATSDEVIGNVNPDWIGGINNMFSYKDFSLSFLVDWQQGGDIFSLDMWYGWTTGLYEETAEDNDLGNPRRLPISEGGGIVLDGVLEDGRPNDIRIENDVLGEASFFLTSPRTRHIYDASYIKLRELIFTYELPQRLMSKTPLYAASVSFVGSNLWIIHKNLPHADPEANQGAGNIQGWQSGVMPTTRNFGVSINVQF